MSEAARVLPLFARGASVERVPEERRDHGLSLDDLYGRLAELSGPSGASGVLTAALSLVARAQRRREPVAWVTAEESCFFPPDAAEGGVDLDTLVVVRVPDAKEVPRAGDALLRSGAFGLLVLDLGAKARVPMPLLTRLSGLARKHDVALAFLTEKGSELPSLGSLVSLRAEVSFARQSPSSETFSLAIRVLKDKRRAPGWSATELCRGPAGL